MDFFLFWKMPAKTYFGCYHWDSPALLPEGIFCFCLIVCLFCFPVSVSKMVGRMAVYLEKLWVGMEGPEKQNKPTTINGWNGKRVHSALFHPVVGGSRSTWEVRSIGKGKALGLSPGDWRREWGFPKEEEGKETVPEGSLCADKVGGLSDEIACSKRNG